MCVGGEGVETCRIRRAVWVGARCPSAARRRSTPCESSLLQWYQTTHRCAFWRRLSRPSCSSLLPSRIRPSSPLPSLSVYQRLLLMHCTMRWLVRRLVDLRGKSISAESVLTPSLISKWTAFFMAHENQSFKALGAASASRTPASRPAGPCALPIPAVVAMRPELRGGRTWRAREACPVSRTAARRSGGAHRSTCVWVQGPTAWQCTGAPSADAHPPKRLRVRPNANLATSKLLMGDMPCATGIQMAYHRQGQSLGDPSSSTQGPACSAGIAQSAPKAAASRVRRNRRRRRLPPADQWTHSHSSSACKHRPATKSSASRLHPTATDSPQSWARWPSAETISSNRDLPFE